MLPSEKARVLMVLRKHVDGVSFYGAPGNLTVLLACEDVAAALGIPLRELYKGTRYAKKGA